jgi:hypothetical protein
MEARMRVSLKQLGRDAISKYKDSVLLARIARGQMDLFGQRRQSFGQHGDVFGQHRSA